MKRDKNVKKKKLSCSKIIQQILVILPVLILVIAIVSKWSFPNSYKVLIKILAVVCWSAAIILFLIAKYKYKSRAHSLGATFINLMIMKEGAGFFLIVASILSFSFLVNYIQALANADLIPYESIIGAIFSIGLLSFVVTILNFIEEQKLARTKIPENEKPVPTPGLILTLSILRQDEGFHKFVENLERLKISPIEFKRIFSKIEGLDKSKREGELELLFANHKDRADDFQFYKYLSDSSLFPMIKAITHHREKLSKVWVLLTEEAKETSWDVFKKLIEKFYRDIKDNLIEKNIKDADDIHEISRCIDNIYLDAAKEFKFDEQEITADITGGTSSVSVGIILACVRSKRRVQYLSQINSQLQKIDVNVHSIPHLFDEMIKQVELIQKKEKV